MRIAFCGKGGSGKSTLASLFARYLAKDNNPVLVVDGDINQHLGEALGFTPEQIQKLPRLGVEQHVMNAYVAGTNTRIQSTDHVLETTLPGKGSNLIYFDEANPVFDHFQIENNGIRFMSVGGHTDEDIGATCFHKFTGAFGVLLNHMIDGHGQYLIGDMCAGADPFASCSLASRFDAVFLVVEPTLKSVGVYDQCRAYGDPFGVKIYVIGNKIEDEQDEAFIKERVGDSYIGGFGNSKFVRDLEKGRDRPVTELEEEHRQVLGRIRMIMDQLTRDWDRYLETGKYFHRQAAESWGNDLMKTDLMQQIDPDFSYHDVIQNFRQAG